MDLMRIMFFYLDSFTIIQSDLTHQKNLDLILLRKGGKILLKKFFKGFFPTPSSMPNW